MMPSSVERSFEFLRNWTGILYAIDDTPVASQVFSQMIERLKQQLGQEFRSVLGTWAREFKSLCSALDEHHRAAIDFHAYLCDVELVLSDDALKARHALAMGHLTAPGELTERMKTFCQAAFEFKQAHIEAYLRWHETVHSQERFSRVAELTNHPAIRVAGQMHKLTWIAMPGMPSLMQAVRSLSANICLQPALDQWLQRRPICPRCRLRLGENIRTASMTDLVNEAEIVIRDFISAFHESPVRERVVEFTQQSELPEVRDIASLLNVAADSSPDEILPILNDRTIDRLRFLMSPKRTVRRDIEALRLSFDGQTMTRSEAAMTFERWLDGEDELRDDDKVEFVIG
jgi:hypothetical protein